MSDPSTPNAARRESFFFGIPLIARSCAADWRRVGDLLELVLRSVLAQTDGGFTLFLAGHDAPESWIELTRGDPRFRFLKADWDPERPTSRNDDGGCKKWMIKERVHAAGGGLLMYLDADDLVDRRLVEVARARMRPEHVGAVVDGGIILDFSSLRAVRLPHREVYDGAFLELCGSSTIGRVEPASADPVRRDPHEALGSHHRWPEAAAETGVALARLPLRGAYLVNTAENHSELHGPFAEWRQALNAAVAREGTPMDRQTAAAFGIDLDLLAAKSRAPAARMA